MIEYLYVITILVVESIYAEIFALTKHEALTESLMLITYLVCFNYIVQVMWSIHIWLKVWIMLC